MNQEAKIKKQERKHNPSNVFCKKCEYWMWVGLTKETEEGYICNECSEKEETLSEFERIGKENFGSGGIQC